METINYNFKIDLFGTGWDNVYPECIVYLNDTVQWHGTVKERVQIEFDADLEDVDGTAYQLQVQYLNRNSSDDVIRENDVIVKNRQIEIENICIDDIELEYYSILYSLGETSYTDLDYIELHKKDPEQYPLVRNGNTVLGAEARWTLRFQMPFYFWLLENM